MRARSSPASAATNSATDTGTFPSQARKETVVDRLFCAMKMISRSRTTPKPTVAAQKPLVREPRNGFLPASCRSSSSRRSCSRAASASSATLDRYPLHVSDAHHRHQVPSQDQRLACSDVDVVSAKCRRGPSESAGVGRCRTLRVHRHAGHQAGPGVCGASLRAVAALSVSLRVNTQRCLRPLQAPIRAFGARNVRHTCTTTAHCLGYCLMTGERLTVCHRLALPTQGAEAALGLPHVGQ